MKISIKKKNLQEEKRDFGYQSINIYNRNLYIVGIIPIIIV
jgi:hypothetical protein